jgi:glycosyltransferase involved in cell wall biosynthesis
LLPPGDAVALANAFQRLNADPLLRDQMGQAGREKILRDFNLQDSTAKRVTLFTARSTSVGEQL